MSFKKYTAVLIALILLLTEFSCFAEETAGAEPGEISYTLPDGRSSLYVLKEGEECPFLAAGEVPEITVDSYRSEDVYIRITSDRYTIFTTPKGKKEERSSAMFYCADIYIRDIRCMERVYANGKFASSSAKVTKMADDANAILATNGDYACELSQGVVIANGKVMRKNSNRKRDMCVIRTDGTMSVIPYGTSMDYKKMISDGLLDDSVWHMFLFGPNLLDENGDVFEYKVFSSKTNVSTNNPRTAIGYFEPGHYCLVVTDGRTKASLGLRIEALAQFMKELGCKAAYNLDGGQSSQMCYLGNIINKPYNNGRKVNDILIIRDLKDEERQTPLTMPEQNK